MIDKGFIEKRKGEYVFCSICARVRPSGALEDTIRNAGRVFYFDEGARATTKPYFESLSKAQKSR